MVNEMTFSPDKLAVGVLIKEAEGLKALANNMPACFSEVIDCLLCLHGRIVVTGIGKSGHVARKIAATLASTGTPAFFLHPTEASHGDLGMITPGDAILAFSNSGNSPELIPIMQYAMQHGNPVLGVTRSATGFLGKHATYILLIPDMGEADALDCAPTISSTMQMALGDAIALCLMQSKGFTSEDFHSLHPGGALGARLRLVDEIMHVAGAMPLVEPGDLMSEVLLVMTGRGFGVVGIVEDDKLVGIITDGDLRRHLQPHLLELTASDVMHPDPVVIHCQTMVAAAVKLMEDRKISSLFVVENMRPVGFVHLHDCLRRLA